MRATLWADRNRKYGVRENVNITRQRYASLVYCALDNGKMKNLRRSMDLDAVTGRGDPIRPIRPENKDPTYDVTKEQSPIYKQAGPMDAHTRAHSEDMVLKNASSAIVPRCSRIAQQRRLPRQRSTCAASLPACQTHAAVHTRRRFKRAPLSH